MINWFRTKSFARRWLTPRGLAAQYRFNFKRPPPLDEKVEKQWREIIYVHARAHQLKVDEDSIFDLLRKSYPLFRSNHEIAVFLSSHFRAIRRAGAGIRG